MLQSPSPGMRSSLMRVLLDECLPRRVKGDIDRLTQHDGGE